ncbi:MAG: hypothetical protein MMC33_006240 [Icmadophila ericetorum]|nr:hypothetical protein [Icmadophila ericetorum]
MVGTDGSKLHFHGFKIIDFATIFSPHLLWTASATLYSTITHLDGSLVGRGIIEVELLGPSGFTTEVDSFTPSGNSLFAKVSSSTRYVTYFARQLATIFIGPLNFLQWPSPGFRGYKNKQTPLPFLLVAPQDGVKTKLHRWEPSPTAHCHSSIPILFIPGVGMDYQTFALPTLKQNAVEYFQAAGYRVYCVSHRIGNTVATENAYTTYDVRLDIFAALEKIREQLKSEKVYVIAHGEGAIALSMGLLDGTIPRDWIKGITASQVFMHPKLAEVNMWKATKLPSSLATMYRLLVGNWFSCTSTKSDSLVQKLLDQVLRFYPVGEWKETCNHVVCHRTELVFGRYVIPLTVISMILNLLWRYRLFAHANINQDTHDQLQNFIGGVSLSCLTHLIAMGVSGQPLIPDSASSISTSSSSTTTTKASSQNLLSNPSNLDRLRGIPIFLFSGSETAVYSPEATEASYELLQDQLGPDDYERSVFRGRGYADVWMGEEGDFRDGNDDDEVDGDGDRVWEEVRKRIDSVCRPVER